LSEEVLSSSFNKLIEYEVERVPESFELKGYAYQVMITNILENNPEEIWLFSINEQMWGI